MKDKKEAGAPVKQRIQFLDVLRGVAIFGTLGTNIWLFSMVGSESGGLLDVNPWWSSWDDFLLAATTFFTNGKFLGMLTILFGVGLEIQYQSARRRGLRWPIRYLWRSVLLLFEGFLHYLLVFEFDILMGYAVVAIIVAFMVGRSERFIKRAMWISGGIHVFFAGLLSITISLFLLSEESAETSVNLFDEEAVRVYTSGSWLEQASYRLNNFFVYRVEAVAIIPMGIFLFLLGVRLMRSGAFANNENGRRLRRKMLKWGLLLGVPLNLLSFAPGYLFEVPVRYLFAPILSVGYIGLVALIFERGWMAWLSDRMAEVGRMALSCYVLQNVLASVVFYGWGFGLTGQVASAGTLAILFAIFTLLLLFSNLWLRRFSQGPFEAVLRTLSLLPSRKSKQKGQATYAAQRTAAAARPAARPEKTQPLRKVPSRDGSRGALRQKHHPRHLW